MLGKLLLTQRRLSPLPVSSQALTAQEIEKLLEVLKERAELNGIQTKLLTMLKNKR